MSTLRNAAVTALGCASAWLSFKFAGITPTAPAGALTDGTAPALFCASVTVACEVWKR